MKNQSPRYRRFFLFGLALALLLIIAERLCYTNHTFAQSFLWILLMTGLPLGAALYARYPIVFKDRFALLFLLGMLWMFLGSAGYLELARADAAWVPTYYVPRYLVIVIEELFVGFLLFFPLWFTCGVIELQLYRALESATRVEQRMSYLSAVAGLITGNLIFSLLPSPSPQVLGYVALFVVLTYCLVSFPRLVRQKRFILTTLMLAVLLNSSSYVRSPLEQSYYPRDGSARVVHDDWSRFGRFSVVDSGKVWGGYYDAVIHWFVLKPGVVVEESDPATVRFPFETAEKVDYPLGRLLREGALIAVLGVGGGGELPPLLAAKPRLIYAIDILPNIPRVMRGLGASWFDHPQVVTVVRDGRKFIEQSGEEFDLIYLPITESFFRLSRHLFDPADRLATVQAFRIYRERLKPDGLLVIRKPMDFANWGLLAPNYLRTLKTAGFHVLPLNTANQLVVIASPSEERIQEIILSPEVPFAQAVFEVKEERGAVLDDDRPFLANVMFSPRVTSLVWLSVGGSLFVAWRINQAHLSISTGIPALLCGVNYSLILFALQLVLFFHLPNPLHGSLLGNVLFLMMVGLGAIFFPWRRILFVVSGIVLGTAIVGVVPLRVMIPMTLAVLSGGLFPQLIHRYRTNLAELLILDGAGAAIGGALFLLIPTVFGVKTFLAVTVGIFLLTFAVVFRTITASEK